MNKENDLNQMTNADVVLGPIQRLTQGELTYDVKKIKLEKAAGFSEVSTKMIIANGKIEVEVMVDCICLLTMQKKFHMNGRQVWCSRFIKEKEML